MEQWSDKVKLTITFTIAVTLIVIVAAISVAATVQAINNRNHPLTVHTCEVTS